MAEIDGMLAGIISRMATDGQGGLNVGSVKRIGRIDYTTRYDWKQVKEMAVSVGKALIRDFVIDGANDFAYTNIAKWLVGDESFQCIDPITRKVVRGDLEKGIYLAGYTGTGKTECMRIYNEVAKELRLAYRMGNNKTLIYWANYRADSLIQYYAQTGDVGRFISDCKTLCIQDFGAEQRGGGSYMGTKIDVIKQIVESRADAKGLMTHFTSNITMSAGDTISDLYGDRVLDRLFGMCNLLEMRGASRRH